MTRVRTAAVVAALAAAVLAPTAQASVRNGPIAYMDARSDGFQLIVSDADGSRAHRIGTMQDARWPHWSPDGQRLAFEVTDKNNLFQLAIARSDGTGMRQLTHGENEYLGSAWSPDGRSIATIRMQNPSYDVTCLCDSSTKNDLVVLDLTGAVRRVVYSSTQPLSLPAWSPDGSLLAFSEGESAYVSGTMLPAPSNYPVAVESDVSTEALEVIAPDGTGLHRVALGSTPAFSPDGRHLLYSGDGTQAIGAHQVHEIGLDGTGDRQVTSGSWSASMPAYAPDGRTILVSVQDHRGDSYRLARCDLATGRVLRYVSRPGGNAAAPDERAA